MCGRYSLVTTASQLTDAFKVERLPRLEKRYNVAPTQPVLAVRMLHGERRADFLHWGLIPSWADDADIGNRLINARAESALEKPAFRNAMRRRRCLVPATGFYEWKAGANGKQPYHIHMADDSVFAFGGLWEHWQDDQGNEIESCTILTTRPNELLKPIHNRMPVIIPPQGYDPWLMTGEEDAEALQRWLGAPPADRMAATPVSRRVNNPKNDDAKCLEPEENQTLF